MLPIAPLVKLALGALGSAAVIHWLIKEVRRLDQELDQLKADSPVDEAARQELPTLRRDPQNRRLAVVTGRSSRFPRLPVVARRQRRLQEQRVAEHENGDEADDKRGPERFDQHDTLHSRSRPLVTAATDRVHWRVIEPGP